MNYLLKDVTPEQVSEDVAAVMAALKSDPDLRQMAVGAGLKLAEVDAAIQEAGGQKLITVTPTGAGLDPATTAVVIAFAPVAAKITLDIWNHLILPWVKRVRGSDSIKPV